MLLNSNISLKSSVRNENTGKEGGPIHLQSRIDASSLSDAALLEIMGTAKKED